MVNNYHHRHQNFYVENTGAFGTGGPLTLEHFQKSALFRIRCHGNLSVSLTTLMNRSIYTFMLLKECNGSVMYLRRKQSLAVNEMLYYQTHVHYQPALLYLWPLKK